MRKFTRTPDTQKYYAKWEKYERRKRVLQNLNLPHAEYERMIQKLAQELGI